MEEDGGSGGSNSVNQVVADPLPFPEEEDGGFVPAPLPFPDGEDPAVAELYASAVQPYVTRLRAYGLVTSERDKHIDSAENLRLVLNVEGSFLKSCGMIPVSTVSDVKVLERFIYDFQWQGQVAYLALRGGDTFERYCLFSETRHCPWTDKKLTVQGLEGR